MEKLTEDDQRELESEVIEKLACDGLRTIGLAYRDFVPFDADMNQVQGEGSAVVFVDLLFFFSLLVGSSWLSSCSLSLFVLLLFFVCRAASFPLSASLP